MDLSDIGYLTCPDMSQPPDPLSPPIQVESTPPTKHLRLKKTRKEKYNATRKKHRLEVIRNVNRLRERYDLQVYDLSKKSITEERAQMARLTKGFNRALQETTSDLIQFLSERLAPLHTILPQCVANANRFSQRLEKQYASSLDHQLHPEML